MSIIKCPECRQQVSTMAGTCPHCGTKISGQLRKCPSCCGYCLNSQDTCPECGTPLPAPASAEEQAKTTDVKEPAPQRPRQKKKKLNGWKVALAVLVVLLLVGLLCAGGYYYWQQQLLQKEQAEYERLRETTNPDFYQQFLDEHPESEYCDEIRERMLRLQAEADDWQQVQKAVSRSSVTAFMQKYPESLRLRICEDIIDSIDWQEAMAVGSEEAIKSYLTRHPAGRYATDAAETENALRLSKVTSGERALIRGTLEAFFSKAIGGQDIKAASQAIDSVMTDFCGTKDANAETIVQYAREKKEKDVIGLHYLVDQKMNVHKEMLEGGVICYAVEVGVQETISRSDTAQPTTRQYRVSALINQEQKIVSMNITN
ncbi:MAG: zinc ribbon domain-containing protein [Bacteroidaceae bacterium]|nr:zinc ribbon domain-containing protein [Bacteroidaceae bacterium]